MFTRIPKGKVDTISTGNHKKKLTIKKNISDDKFDNDNRSESPSPCSVSDDSLFNSNGAATDEIISCGKKVTFNTVVTVINSNNNKVISNHEAVGSPRNHELRKKKAFIKHLKLDKGDKGDKVQEECTGCSFDPNDYVCNIS
jgi:aspartokinase